MAIRTNKPTVTVPETQEVETTVSQAPTQPTPTQAPTQPTQAPAPAPVQTADVPAVQEDYVAPSIASLRNALDPEVYGNSFPRLVGSNGSLINEQLILGGWIDIQVVSYSDRWMITPVADPKDTEARKYCRASYDGENIPDRDGGEPTPITDYTSDFPGGYKEWKTSKYMDIFGVIFGSEKNTPAGAKLGMVQISFSPTALKKLNAFIVQSRMNVSRGLLLKSHANFMRIAAEIIIGKTNTWTVLNPDFVPAEVVLTYEPIQEL